jgi:hypothetical protein
MATASTQSDEPETLGAFQREFRRDPGGPGALLVVCCILGVLALVGIWWMIVKPDSSVIGRVLTIAALAGVFAGAAFGVRQFWLQFEQRFRLHEHGLSYFDGRTAHRLHWNDIVEITESISTAKMYGITVSGPKLGVDLASRDGVRCSIGTDVQDLEALSTVVAHAVNDCLRKQARKQLRQGEAVKFGPVAVSAHGVVLDAPPPRSWLKSIQDRVSDIFPPEIEPCQLEWQEVTEIRVASRTHGEKMARQITFNQLEIRRRGRKAPVCAYPVPQFPNFTVFAEVLEQLGHPLRGNS